ncbi:hypothetical protein [Streptomyces coffeae]|uniref:Uncharacterized protein n=1 Tax=Streptomyces coffeae TaxID=621382 RepID=A0ABS1NIN0_9ACTN|nr:hypothetical protein [Streptomyces coffeae]MBL1099886.1 hypothetical protein [Streptomyces coffeae]
MTDSVPVRCPACRREQSFTPPTFPCSCGAPLTLPVLRDGAPEEIEHRTWQNIWVVVDCPSCGRRGHWPQPEFGCGCGRLVRVPVTPPSPVAAPASGPAVPRPAFRPVTIRTARDAVTAAAEYLKWLGFTDPRHPEDPEAGVDLYGEGLVARVDPATRPAELRDVECLWLHGLQRSALSVFFSLAGYARDARARGDALRIPLFIMDLTGTPQPVNDPADVLIRTGPPER